MREIVVLQSFPRAHLVQLTRTFHTVLSLKCPTLKIVTLRHNLEKHPSKLHTASIVLAGWLANLL